MFSKGGASDRQQAPTCGSTKKNPLSDLCVLCVKKLPIAIMLLGCAAMVPVPPTGPHVGDEPAEVPHPPPPARAEILPPQPNADAVWVDGHWSWTGDQYAWVPGGWQKPRPGSYYAPANTVRRRNGELLYYEGHWHADSSAAKGSP